MKITLSCLLSCALAGCAAFDPLPGLHPPAYSKAEADAIAKRYACIANNDVETKEHVKVVIDELDAKFHKSDGDVQRRNSIFPPAHPEIRAAWVAAHPALSVAVAKAITDGAVCFGMNGDEVMASWSRPRHVNASDGAGGTHEQWCYDDSAHIGWYLYFDDGVLTSWQHEER